MGKRMRRICRQCKEKIKEVLNNVSGARAGTEREREKRISDSYWKERSEKA